MALRIDLEKLEIEIVTAELNRIIKNTNSLKINLPLCKRTLEELSTHEAIFIQMDTELQTILNIIILSDNPIASKNNDTVVSLFNKLFDIYKGLPKEYKLYSDTNILPKEEQVIVGIAIGWDCPRCDSYNECYNEDVVVTCSTCRTNIRRESFNI